MPYNFFGVQPIQGKTKHDSSPLTPTDIEQVLERITFETFFTTGQRTNVVISSGERLLR